MPSPTSNDSIDRVDANDHVVGTVPRGDALTAGAGFRVVHVLVLNHAGDVLLQQVGSVGTRSPGRWGSSVAGYLHAGETPLDGARRRMREEIGLTSALTFVGRSKMDDENSTKFIYVYTTTAEQAHIVDERHIQDLRFWPLAAIRSTIEENRDVFTKTLPFVLHTFRSDLG